MVPGSPLETDEGQLAFFNDRRSIPDQAPKPATNVEIPDPVRDELSALDVNALTPLEALNRLADLKRKATR